MVNEATTGTGKGSQNLDEGLERLKEACRLEGKLLMLLEIRDKFGEIPGSIYATFKEWDEFVAPYITKKW